MISSTQAGIGSRSVSITGGLVEPDVVSVEQPTIIETEAFGLDTCRLFSSLCLTRMLAHIHNDN